MPCNGDGTGIDGKKLLATGAWRWSRLENTDEVVAQEKKEKKKWGKTNRKRTSD